MCDVHFQIYRNAMTKPIRGIDRPENAPDDWQPSLLECIRHAQIAAAFEKRNEQRTESPSLHRHDDAKRYTPAQLKQVMILRKHLAIPEDKGEHQ